MPAGSGILTALRQFDVLPEGMGLKVTQTVAKGLSVWLGVFVLAIASTKAFAAPAEQDPSKAASQKQAEEAPTAPSRAPQAPHRFWDTTNVALFAGTAGARALDYTSTRHLRNQGINEWLLSNSVVDNKPLFAAIEAGGVGASIAISYLFHRTGHHKLERWASIVHIAVGVGGSIRNYRLQPNPSSLAPP